MARGLTEDTVTISWDRVWPLIDRYLVRYNTTDGDTKDMEVGKDKSVAALTGLKPSKKHEAGKKPLGREGSLADIRAVTDRKFCFSME